MSNWLVKSSTSSQIASTFLDGTSFDISVHCSYYSCVQLMFHLLYAYFNLSEDDIDNMTDSSINKDNKGTHTVLLKYFIKSLRNKDRTDAFYFNNTVYNLKQFRVNADYCKESISKEDSIKCYEDHLKLNDILNKYYN